MKANVPKKLYYAPYGDIREDYPITDNDIEYTRTDAFIEKALAYLNSKFYFHNAFYGVVSTDFNAMEELFEDFEEYLKK